MHAGQQVSKTCAGLETEGKMHETHHCRLSLHSAAMDSVHEAAFCSNGQRP